MRENPHKRSQFTEEKANIPLLKYLYHYFSGKCAETAKGLGYKYFAIQDGGQCFTSRDAGEKYNIYGKSEKCRNGLGGPMASDVYSL